jgi:hypothetical protein
MLAFSASVTGAFTRSPATTPGAMAFTRMPLVASSKAISRTSIATAALDEL